MERPYVTAQNESDLSDLLAKRDERIVALGLDVTNEASIQQTATQSRDVTLLINDAGYAAFTGAISAMGTAAARREMEVNYFEILSVTRAFAPVLAANGGGTIVNMLSMLSLISLPLAAMPARP